MYRPWVLFHFSFVLNAHLSSVIAQIPHIFNSLLIYICIDADLAVCPFSFMYWFHPANNIRSVLCRYLCCAFTCADRTTATAAATAVASATTTTPTTAAANSWAKSIGLSFSLCVEMTLLRAGGGKKYIRKILNTRLASTSHIGTFLFSHHFIPILVRLGLWLKFNLFFCVHTDFLFFCFLRFRCFEFRGYRSPSSWWIIRWRIIAWASNSVLFFSYLISSVPSFLLLPFSVVCAIGIPFTVSADAFFVVDLGNESILSRVQANQSDCESSVCVDDRDDWMHLCLIALANSDLCSMSDEKNRKTYRARSLMPCNREATCEWIGQKLLFTTILHVFVSTFYDFRLIADSAVDDTSLWKIHQRIEWIEEVKYIATTARRSWDDDDDDDKI